MDQTKRSRKDAGVRLARPGRIGVRTLATAIGLVVGSVLALGSVSGCATTPPPPTPAALAADTPRPAPEPEPFPASIVWTTEPETPIEADDGSQIDLEHPFTRLEVIGRDTIGLRVLCAHCSDGLEGYVSEEAILHDYLPPEVTAWGEMTEFALSVREAARRHDLDALRPIMSPDFSFSFIGSQNPEAAFQVWRSEGFSTLDRLPEIIDQGLASADGRIWSAPPAFVEDLYYRGLRLGFRERADGRWEWIYLIAGIGR